MASNAGGCTEAEALCILNALKTNVSKVAKKEEITVFRGCLERAGLTVEDLNCLNIIHVTGTKGKGSTCAFTEQILRGYGFSTGFFSSPHLVHVRERIRMNGKPVGKELFLKYFWQVYRRLDETKDAHGGAMPTHFGFFTILAFHLFLQEKVDLAVIEVGIGGEYDCTNVIRKPWVCGITTLDMDHTEILGNTIESIAWRKGGIFKPGVPAFTVRQPEDAMAVLRDRAQEIDCPLGVCPDLDEYLTDSEPLHLGLAGRHQHSNASLALQLCHTWLQRRYPPDKAVSSTCAENSSLHVLPFKPSPIMVRGLADTQWAGRAQIVKHGPVTYFLDGAHTMRSIQACVDWFREAAAQHQRRDSESGVRVLLFNTTGQRDSAAMLKLLVPCHFDFAVFCPNITEDQQNVNPLEDVPMARCLDNESSWLLHNSQHDDNDIQLLTDDNLLHFPEKKGDTMVFPCILSALQWITQGRDHVVAAKTVPPVKPSITAKTGLLCDAAEIHVLITGSLHLVGGVLQLLDSSAAE
ncbi:uncharacterized protein V6R79_008226 [Siganus canaliculatus]